MSWSPDRLPTSALSLGQVVLAADPDHPGRLRLHRLAVINADGTLTLRGDANGANDSTPVRRDDVRGVAVLRIPYLGKIELWRSEHDIAALALFAAALGTLSFGCRLYRPLLDPVSADHDEVDHSHTDTRAGLPVALRRLTALTAILLTLAGVTVAGAPRAQAATKFARTTSIPTNTWSAVPYFTCKSAVLANSPFFYYQFGENSGLTAADSSGNGRTGGYQGTRWTYGVTGSCARDNNAAVTLNGSSDYVSTPSLVNNPTVFTQEIWFKTTTTSGGDLLGFANTQLGVSTSSDRQLYLTNGGRVVFGMSSGTIKTISSPKTYNDGSWHLADAVLSSAGEQLYLDGQLVASDATVTAAQNYLGYWRIGQNNLTGWTNAPTSSYLAATIDDAAVYTSALTAGQIAGHYTAG